MPSASSRSIATVPAVSSADGNTLKALLTTLADSNCPTAWLSNDQKPYAEGPPQIKKAKSKPAPRRCWEQCCDCETIREIETN